MRFNKYVAILGVSALFGLIIAPPAVAAPSTPRISQVQTSAVSAGSVRISWTTDVTSDSLVSYGTSSPLPSNAPQVFLANAVTNHSIQLNDLSPATQYYFN